MNVGETLTYLFPDFVDSNPGDSHSISVSLESRSLPEFMAVSSDGKSMEVLPIDNIQAGIFIIKYTVTDDDSVSSGLVRKVTEKFEI